MSKKPSVELRRRNNKPHGSTPTDEMKELLEAPHSVKTEPGANAQQEFSATSNERDMSEVTTGIDREQLKTGVLPGPGYMLSEHDAERSSESASVPNETYRPKNLILVVTRPAASLSPELNASIKLTLELFPHVIDGAARGFTINLDAKAAYEPKASSLRMTFDERAGRAIGKLFETWGREIGRVGVGAHTTVDFMLLEPDATGRSVLDAWNCRSMFPTAMTTSQGARFLNGSRNYAQLDTIWNGNVQLMEDPSSAQALLDRLLESAAVA
jgi:hypothetical protein